MYSVKSLLRRLGLGSVGESSLELPPANDDPARPNRLCLTISDIHLTDGTAGIQNLDERVWDAFFDKLLDTCKHHDIVELVLVLDGDVVDIIRSGRWAQQGVYPWERDRTQFSQCVNDIMVAIIQKHRYFFDRLKGLPEFLKQGRQGVSGCKTIKDVETIVILGNHDKEILAVPEALEKFYRDGLGRSEFDDDYRRYIGRMYGDEAMFLNPATVPYLPFYYGDRGFRFFTTHGQWRDAENSRKIRAKDDLPGWSVADGWDLDAWKRLRFSPFILPCFGDTVAAGVLSTFIYRTKKDLDLNGLLTPRLGRILDELDLYRPSYLALLRILDETKRMREVMGNEPVIRIIEDRLHDGIIDWLGWEFTYQSSPPLRWLLLIVVRGVLKILDRFKSVNVRARLMGISYAMRLLAFMSHYSKKGVKWSELKGFTAFLPQYAKYGFQIHGEGHTHKPLQEEAKLGVNKPLYSYVNFGTWRDQIVPRKKTGYRRRGVLRAFYILDLLEDPGAKSTAQRSFSYYTQDIIIWNDELDNLDQLDSGSTKISLH